MNQIPTKNTSPIQSIVLGVTGGVAAYKAVELTRLLQKSGIQVQVVMTEAACRFITPTTFQAISGKTVLVDAWDQHNMAHIHLSRQADLILIAPTTADFMAKLAHGLADDLLSSLCLARNCPLWIAPAMNPFMWSNPATQRNLAQLQQDGIQILGPESGQMACGEEGLGRMLAPEKIVATLTTPKIPAVLHNKRVLLTAGPTYEAIDVVRGITNRSSGKMGYALAQAARDAGAEVTLVSGPTKLEAPWGVNKIAVESAEQMLHAVTEHIDDQDLFIAVAAVADYRVAQPSQQKIKKEHQNNLTLNLVPNPDILAYVARLPNAPFCVGFAAESEQLLEYGEQKRQRKNIPILIGNIAQEAIGQDDNEILIFEAQGITRLARNSKLNLAYQLIQHISQRYHERML